jgi:HK97 family phage major capsid protein
MDLKAQRAAAFKAAQELLEKEDYDAAEAKLAEVKAFDEKIARASKGSDLLKQLGNLNETKGDEGDAREKGLQAVAANTLGDHFAKSIYAQVKENIGKSGYVAKTPEWMGAKAATDTQGSGTVFNTPVLTEFDRTIVPLVRQELIVADLLGTGTISGTAIQYFLETGPMEGAFTTVAEGAAKPQVHFPDPTVASDTLKKIAGFLKFTDEMMEDLPFVVSEINNRLLYELAKFEETQLLNGNGTGTNILGLLNRSGIQLNARAANGAGTADDESVADAIFRSISLVQTGSGLVADGIVIHPTDYQTLRLSKDGNGQYFGGGYFQGQYGNGGILQNPPLWGLRTVVSTATTVGTVLVGAFKQGATVYRKGGIRVESTNSHSDDFTNNKITVRAEERLALAVRRPAAFVKTTITTPV